MVVSLHVVEFVLFMKNNVYSRFSLNFTYQLNALEHMHVNCMCRLGYHERSTGHLADAFTVRHTCLSISMIRRRWATILLTAKLLGFRPMLMWNLSPKISSRISSVSTALTSWFTEYALELYICVLIVKEYCLEVWQ